MGVLLYGFSGPRPGEQSPFRSVRDAPTPCGVRDWASLPPPVAGEHQATGDPGGRTMEEHT